MFITKKLAVTALLAACLSAGAQIALAQDHHAHHEGGAARLALNNGKKWATDDNLRQGMASIRDALAAELPAIHSGKASVAQYQALAEKVNDQITFMVQNCKLDKNADTMLHLILAELTAGADAMASQKNSNASHQGAEKIAHALEEYAAYFDHPGWSGAK